MLCLYSTIKSKIQKFSDHPGKVTMHFVVLLVDVGKRYPSHSVVLYLRSSYCYLATIYHVRLSIEDSNIDHRNVEFFSRNRDLSDNILDLRISEPILFLAVSAKQKANLIKRNFDRDWAKFSKSNPLKKVLCPLLFNLHQHHHKISTLSREMPRDWRSSRVLCLDSAFPDAPTVRARQ